MGQPKPLFHSVKEHRRKPQQTYTILDVFVALCLGVVLTATGMHFFYNIQPSEIKIGQQLVPPYNSEDTAVTGKAAPPPMVPRSRAQG